VIRVVLEQPGRFAVADAPAPVIGPGESLVRIHRIGVCGTDLHAFGGRQPFFAYPRVLGHELGVEVVDPGSSGSTLRRGDRCSVEPYLNCGRCSACRRGKTNCCTELKVLGVHTDGGMQSLMAVPASKLHRSTVLSYEQLALIEMLAIGAHAVERSEIKRDDFALVIGAGPIGLSVIQFALLSGARIAVMDMSSKRLEFCRKHFGITDTLEPTEAVDRLKKIGGGDRPHVVFDATGNPRSMASTFDLVEHGGRIVFVGLFQGDVTFNDPNFHRRELTLCATRNALGSTFQNIIRMAETGHIDTGPWITHRYRLPETPAAFSRVAQDSALIKSVITVEQ
jgi:2-desacetyl-2-hydroxyethyl bacteriochlorophyllide A dehydrogenase